MNYQPKVYRRQGGDVQVIASGGKIVIQTGGIIAGNDETQAAHIADPTDLAECITAITAINVVLAATGLTASS